MNHKGPKFAARLNSFAAGPSGSSPASGGDDGVGYLIRRAANVPQLTHLDLNYPEHFAETDTEKLRTVIRQCDLQCNGVALRFGKNWNNGDFSNPQPELRAEAIECTHQAASACRELGGETLTLWFAHDGNDYPFEIAYESAWRTAVDGVREIARSNGDLKIAIEYKPFQPRAYALFGDLGTVLTAIEATGAENLGVTLDYCHMLMKRENPTFSLVLAAMQNRLYGVHLNDGYGDNDDGMMIGSVNLMRLVEFVYYLKLYDYGEPIYFDTFPERVDPVQECRANIETFLAVERCLERLGLERLEATIKGRDAIGSQELLISILDGCRR